jgi:sugar phosphate isomerase/epimerase
MLQMTQMLRFALSSQACSQVPCKEAIALAAEAGFQGYHLILGPEMTETDLEEVKRASQEVGLEITSVEWIRQASSGTREELEAAIDSATVLGSPRLVIETSPRPANPAEMTMSFQREAQIISGVLDSDRAQDIEVCIKIQPQTLAHDHYSSIGLLQLIDRFSARLMMDPVELCLAGTDYSVTALRAIHDRLGMFVLRGVRHTGGGFEDVPLSCTTLYMQEHLGRLLETDFQGFLLLGTHLPASEQSLLDAIRDELKAATEFLREIGMSNS